MWNFINKILEKLFYCDWDRSEQEELHIKLLNLLREDTTLTNEQFKILYNIIFCGGEGHLYDSPYIDSYFKEARKYSKLIRNNKTLWNDPTLLYYKFKEELL